MVFTNWNWAFFTCHSTMFPWIPIEVASGVKVMTPSRVDQVFEVDEGLRNLALSSAPPACFKAFDRDVDQVGTVGREEVRGRVVLGRVALDEVELEGLEGQSSGSAAGLTLPPSMTTHHDRPHPGPGRRGRGELAGRATQDGKGHAQTAQTLVEVGTPAG